MSKIKCGVEDAGRGPVIGPMVMASCTIKEEDEIKLKVLGVKDSKLLTPQKREELYKAILKTVTDYSIKVVTPLQIDNALKDSKMNLNWLEAKVSADMINDLKPDVSVLDCPSTNIKAYNDYVKNLVNYETEIISEHKADVNHPIVSAASILAKVTRDKEIQKIKDKLEINFGSGYPSDPLTVDFLEKNYKKYENIFRKTWASYQRVVKKNAQKSLSEF